MCADLERQQSPVQVQPGFHLLLAVEQGWRAFLCSGRGGVSLIDVVLTIGQVYVPTSTHIRTGSLFSTQLLQRLGGNCGR